MSAQSSWSTLLCSDALRVLGFWSEDEILLLFYTFSLHCGRNFFNENQDFFGTNESMLFQKTPKYFRFISQTILTYLIMKWNWTAQSQSFVTKKFFSFFFFFFFFQTVSRPEQDLFEFNLFDKTVLNKQNWIFLIN